MALATAAPVDTAARLQQLQRLLECAVPRLRQVPGARVESLDRHAKGLTQALEQWLRAPGERA